MMDFARRTFLTGLATFGLSPFFVARDAQAEAAKGYVLAADEGEHLIRNRGSILIKADPTRGAGGLAMGTQQVPVGGGIPIHRHFHMDEAFYVIEGSGSFILDEQKIAIAKGGTIFIPKNAWHGFTNPDAELLLLWIVAPAGLEAFFREVASPPGEPQKSLTKVQLNEIARRHAMEFR
jgi:quercetin dioxygenase-like cupin family protein